MIDAALRRRRWRRLLPRVYLVGGGPATPAQRVRAASLWAGYDSVVAGAAATWWRGIDDSAPTVVDLVVPPARSMTVQAGIRLVRPLWIRGMCRGAMESVSPLRRAVASTWYVGASVTSWRTACAAGGLPVDNLYRRWRTAAADVGEGGLARRCWRSTPILGPRLNGSPIRCCGSADCPAGWRIPDGIGRRDRVPGHAFEDVKLAVEINGPRFHDLSGDAEAWERDHERELALVRAGWTVIRLTYRQLMEQPDKVVAVIRGVLERLRSAAAP